MSDHHKFICGIIQTKRADFGLTVEEILQPIVAGEVAYTTQSLVSLVGLCANYLIHGFRIDISIGLWISTRPSAFKAKLFILGRKLRKSAKKFSIITQADNEKNINLLKKECVNRSSLSNFNSINFNDLNCYSLAFHEFHQNNIDGDFSFNYQFTDYLNIHRTFRFLLTSANKRFIFYRWLMEENLYQYY